MRFKKPFLLLVALLALGLGVFFAFDLERYFSLAFAKESQAGFSAYYEQRPVLVTLVFFVVFVAIAALSLPGAAILTLASGASFGLVWGTVVVSLASTLGATLAMLAARTLLHGAMEKRFGKQLAEVNQGLARDGALYLFTLRMVPAIPFAALNLLMGLTRMKTWTFFWVSQLGMLAGTAAYVYAGTELARIESVRDVLSPGLLGALALLGVLPLAASKVLDALQRHTVRTAPGRTQALVPCKRKETSLCKDV